MASLAAEQVTREIEKNIGHVDRETIGKGVAGVTAERVIERNMDGHVDGETSGTGVTSVKKDAGHVNGDTSVVSSRSCR